VLCFDSFDLQFGKTLTMASFPMVVRTANLLEDDNLLVATVRQDASADKSFNMGFAEANPCFVGNHQDFAQLEGVSLGSLNPRHPHDSVWFQTKLPTTYATNSVHPTSLGKIRQTNPVIDLMWQIIRT
jgi:hypothetical protein